MSYPLDVVTAATLLGLELPADRLSVAQAHRRGMKQHHPDVTGLNDSEMAKQINAARAILDGWLNGASAEVDGDEAADGPEESKANGPPRAAGVPVAGFAPPKDFRSNDGALWAGIVVPAETALPVGWFRASSKGGSVWTKLPGDRDALVAALLLALPESVFARLPAWDDLRHTPGGNLWSGFEVEAAATLPPGWARASSGKHAGQAYSRSPGDARSLVEALWRSLNPGLDVCADD
jgi:hypothetical protein